MHPVQEDAVTIGKQILSHLRQANSRLKEVSELCYIRSCFIDVGAKYTWHVLRDIESSLKILNDATNTVAGLTRDPQCPVLRRPEQRKRQFQLEYQQ